MSIDRERFTMVDIIGRIVAETYFRRKVEMRSKSHCLLREACKSLAMSLIHSGVNDYKTRSRRGGWNEMALVKN